MADQLKHDSGGFLVGDPVDPQQLHPEGGLAVLKDIRTGIDRLGTLAERMAKAMGLMVHAGRAEDARPRGGVAQDWPFKDSVEHAGAQQNAGALPSPGAMASPSMPDGELAGRPGAISTPVVGVLRDGPAREIHRDSLGRFTRAQDAAPRGSVLNAVAKASAVAAAGAAGVAGAPGAAGVPVPTTNREYVQDRRTDRITSRTVESAPRADRAMPAGHAEKLTTGPTVDGAAGYSAAYEARKRDASGRFQPADKEALAALSRGGSRGADPVAAEVGKLTEAIGGIKDAVGGAVGNAASAVAGAGNIDPTVVALHEAASAAAPVLSLAKGTASAAWGATKAVGGVARSAGGLAGRAFGSGLPVSGPTIEPAGRPLLAGADQKVAGRGVLTRMLSWPIVRAMRVQSKESRDSTKVTHRLLRDIADKPAGGGEGRRGGWLLKVLMMAVGPILSLLGALLAGVLKIPGLKALAGLLGSVLKGLVPGLPGLKVGRKPGSPASGGPGVDVGGKPAQGSKKPAAWRRVGAALGFKGLLPAAADAPAGSGAPVGPARPSLAQRVAGRLQRVGAMASSGGRSIASSIGRTRIGGAVARVGGAMSGAAGRAASIGGRAVGALAAGGRMAGRFLRGVPGVGVLLAAGTLGAKAIGGEKVTGGDVGGAVGGVSGGLAGAALGSLVGPIGTVVGGMVGSWLGERAGSFIGDAVAGPLSQFIDDAKLFFSRAYDAISGGLSKVWDAISSGAAKFWDALKNSEPVKWAGEKIDQAKQKVADGVEAVKNSAPAQWVGRRADEVAQAAASVVERVTGKGPSFDFVATHGDAAQRVSQETGIPAQFLLAQSAHETGWGRKRIIDRDTGAESNNLFGIKAGKGWTGPVANITTTEVYNGKPVKVVDKFRAYESPEESMRDYAKLILTNRRYAGARGATTAEAYFGALQAGGYATDPAYAQKMAAISRSKALQPIAAKGQPGRGPVLADVAPAGRAKEADGASPGGVSKAVQKVGTPESPAQPAGNQGQTVTAAVARVGTERGRATNRQKVETDHATAKAALERTLSPARIDAHAPELAAAGAKSVVPAGAAAARHPVAAQIEALFGGGQQADTLRSIAPGLSEQQVALTALLSLTGGSAVASSAVMGASGVSAPAIPAAGVATPSVPPIPTPPKIAAAPIVVPNMPDIPAPMQQISTPKSGPVEVTIRQPVTQNLADRSLANIVTGGIGAG